LTDRGILIEHPLVFFLFARQNVLLRLAKLLEICGRNHELVEPLTHFLLARKTYTEPPAIEGGRDLHTRGMLGALNPVFTGIIGNVQIGTNKRVEA